MILYDTLYKIKHIKTCWRALSFALIYLASAPTNARLSPWAAGSTAIWACRYCSYGKSSGWRSASSENYFAYRSQSQCSCSSASWKASSTHILLLSTHFSHWIGTITAVFVIVISVFAECRAPRYAIEKGGSLLCFSSIHFQLWVSYFRSPPILRLIIFDYFSSSIFRAFKSCPSSILQSERSFVWS